jgi:hypothetical protein
MNEKENEMKKQQIESEMKDVMRKAKLAKTIKTLELRIDCLCELVERIAKTIQTMAAQLR